MFVCKKTEDIRQNLWISKFCPPLMKLEKLGWSVIQKVNFSIKLIKAEIMILLHWPRKFSLSFQYRFGHFSVVVISRVILNQKISVTERDWEIFLRYKNWWIKIETYWWPKNLSRSTLFYLVRILRDIFLGHSFGFAFNKIFSSVTLNIKHWFIEEFFSVR